MDIYIHTKIFGKGKPMYKLLTTNVKIEDKDYLSFRILAYKKQLKIGEYIGRLISAEVRKNIDVIRGE